MCVSVRRYSVANLKPKLRQNRRLQVTAEIAIYYNQMYAMFWPCRPRKIIVVCATVITLCCRGLQHWGDLSRAQARAMVWNTCDAQSLGPHPYPHWQDSMERTSQYSWCQVGCRGYWKAFGCKTVLLLSSTPDFLLGLTPLAFAIPLTSARQRRFIVRVFLLCTRHR